MFVSIVVTCLESQFGGGGRQDINKTMTAFIVIMLKHTFTKELKAVHLWSPAHNGALDMCFKFKIFRAGSRLKQPSYTYLPSSNRNDI